MSLSILVFTWNTSSIPFCSEVFNWQCRVPDFWNPIVDKIELIHRVLVIFAFQDVANLNTFPMMQRLGYKSLGIASIESCQLSVYTSDGRFQPISANQITLPDGMGTLLPVRLPNNQTLGVVNVCAEDLKAFPTLIQKLAYQPPLDYVLLCGSFNLSPECPVEISLDDPRDCSDVDPFRTSELQKYLLEEGRNNKGPNFPPTCYLARQRTYHQASFLTPHFGDPLPPRHEVQPQDFVSPMANWCDRIFYGTFRSIQGFRLRCLEYDRLDDPHTSLKWSQHAIVYGLFEISS
jgi:hypothetical protein